MANQTIVKMIGITKEFPGVRALHNVDIDVSAGEIHALVGENGAGKSTLIKILMGVHQKTAGEVFVAGKKIDVKNPIHAQSLGLSAVYQEINFAQHLTVAENMFMGQLPKNKFGMVNHKKINKETDEIMSSMGIDVGATEIMSDLTRAKQEMVAIGKVLHQKAKFVIFDEPTAQLTTEETEELFRIIQMLKDKNVGILYISHRMEEIFQISDRITVLKDGALVGTVDTNNVTEDDLITMMVGRKLEDMYNIEHVEPGEIVLQVENLSRAGEFEDIHFDVKKGEIFGMFGLVGSGRSEIVHTIFGDKIKNTGTVTFHHKNLSVKKPSAAIAAGMALLPEDRKKQGLALGLSVVENTNMASIKNIAKYGILNTKQGDEIARQYCDVLQTKTPSIHQIAGNLSGGNQQKVVIGKWLAAGSDFFIFDEPTVGVDVGAKVEIYKVFEELIRQGKTIMIISSYLPEVMGLSNRLLVMYEGKQMGILDKSEYSEENVLRLASGMKLERE
ncbi:MAG: sugar ABC transporter ATP-binding protein [Lachnospiraceae bacterium]|nr:sugar ABC transporter ATP-binding protein [Lachnospiraceae bacterium]